MKTAIVILNWNTAGYLERFLPSLIESIKGEDAEIIVADSASTDNSMAVMAERFPAIRTIPLESNFGFTGGYNKALALIDAEYFVLLNSDIEVSEGWLGPLLKLMENETNIGICGPKLLSYYDRDSFEYAGAAGGCIDKFGYPFCRGRILKMVEKDRGQYDSIQDVFWITGACMMIRSSVFKTLGGLDERFFAHMEEIDLCWRAKLAGYRICIEPASVVYHLGGGTLPNDSPWKLKLNYRNNLLMLSNNLARTFAVNSFLDSKNPNLRIIAKKAIGRANRRIWQRMVLDGCSALVYLITGKSAYFRSVIEAHKEFRASRSRQTAEDIEKFLKGLSSRTINGCRSCLMDRRISLYDKWIVWSATIYGKKVFDKVKV